jgi:crossover junction endodeoxyribonuclease RuvC
MSAESAGIARAQTGEPLPHQSDHASAATGRDGAFPGISGGGSAPQIRAEQAVLRLTLGIDPGTSGAIVVLADGEPVRLLDMPANDRLDIGREVNPVSLAAQLRGLSMQYPGAHVMAALELVGSRPMEGSRSVFRFGEGYGVVKGVLGALGIGWVTVRPQAWKKHHGLIGTEKDAARIYAMQRFPRVALSLKRKRDGGRADALLIARWAWETEQHAERDA